MILLRPEEVAEQLALSLRSVYRLARGGELPSVAIGAALRFRQLDVEAFVASKLRGGEGARPEPLRQGGRRLAVSLPRNRS